MNRQIPVFHEIQEDDEQYWGIKPEVLSQGLMTYQDYIYINRRGNRHKRRRVAITQKGLEYFKQHMPAHLRLH